MDRLGEAYDSPTKTELALHLCWAIGEHGGGGESYKDAARELFESLELLLYENLSSRYIVCLLFVFVPLKICLLILAFICCLILVYLWEVDSVWASQQ
uniref:Uncharacterized protein n=1 Tax=Rhizophora mucronata TaxID=61149 RepID=A0A2P2MGK1_RHIMU